MKKIPKPQRAGRGSKKIGNYFIKDRDGKQVNLGTKNANEALARAREFATTGKRNFQDDLDGAAEATIAAVEATPVATSAGIEAPAAPAPPPVPVAPASPAAAPGSAPLPIAQHGAVVGSPPPSPPVNADWRDDARAAAEKAAASSDAAPPKPAPAQLIDPNMIDQFVKTAAGFCFSGQVYMQGKAIEWWTGEKVPPVLPTIERAVKTGGMPQEALDGIKGVRDLSIAGYESFLRRKLPLDNLPDYAVGLIAAGSLASVQYSIAATTKAQKAEAKKRGRAAPTEPVGMPAGTPAAPAAASETENGVGAEAL